MNEYNLTNNKVSDTYPRLVQHISGSFYDGLGNYIEITGSTNGSGSQLTAVDILICTVPRKSGKFILTGSFNPNINVQQAAGVYINKGALTDEAEMDSLKISAIVTNPSTSICYWNCNTSVKGYFKINY